jgi:hypothetical protein
MNSLREKCLLRSPIIGILKSFARLSMRELRLIKLAAGHTPLDQNPVACAASVRQVTRRVPAERLNNGRHEFRLA